ncbi:hypothetical protein GCM10023324_45300 [Streptomyces youssoufiensis]
MCRGLCPGPGRRVGVARCPGPGVGWAARGRRGGRNRWEVARPRCGGRAPGAPAAGRGLDSGRLGLSPAQPLKQKARPPMSQHWICRLAVPALPARSVTVNSAVYVF